MTETQLKSTKKNSRFIPIFFKYILSPLLMGILAVIIIAAVNKARKPDYYYIYMVHNYQDTSLVKLRNAFDTEFNKNKGIQIDDIEVKFRHRDDEGDETRAKEIAQELVSENQTLMIIGNGYSTLVKKSIPYYLKKDNRIPVILTAETNPFLYPSWMKTDDYKLVYRLSPLDKHQAKKAADFAIDVKDAHVFWVIEGGSNSVYSNYLASEFIKNVQKNMKKVILWSTSTFVPPMETLHVLDIDCVFFIGDWTKALILIRQIKQIYTQDTIPTIILCDWSVNKNLIEQGKKDVEGVYLTFPMNAENYNEDGYALYGIDAAKVAKELIKEADNDFSSTVKINFFRQFLRIHRVKDARFAIINAMKEAKIIIDGKLGNGIYSFKSDYMIRDNASFHIWEIKNSKFVDVQVAK